MTDRIVTWAVDRRWLVLLLTTVAAIIGGISLARLAIDAVPDITNNQVQVNVLAPALSPELIEKQVAFPIETALTGIKGLESTRSLSRNGFVQVTAIFSDSTDIYFARSQVQERMTAAQEALPAGVKPAMGPIATGLGEVYIWTLRYAERAHEQHRPGEPGLQPDGSYITPEGDRLASEADKATYLHTVGLDRRAADQDGRRRRRHRLAWRLRERISRRPRHPAARCIEAVAVRSRRRARAQQCRDRRRHCEP